MKTVDEAYAIVKAKQREEMDSGRKPEQSEIGRLSQQIVHGEVAKRVADGMIMHVETGAVSAELAFKGTFGQGILVGLEMAKV